MYISAIITCLINIAEICYIGPRRIVNAFTCCVSTKDLSPKFDEKSQSDKTDDSLGTFYVGTVHKIIYLLFFLLETYV